MILTVTLLATSTVLNTTSAIANTQITLNDLSGFPVSEAETIVFSGRLIKSSSMQGVNNATINIVHYISFDKQALLASVQTDTDGFYSIPWIVSIEEVAAQAGGPFGTESTRGRENRLSVTVFAQFRGDSKFAQSTSNTQSFEVKLDALSIRVERKIAYLPFETATVKIMINDIRNNLVEPDQITVWLDSSPIVLMKENTGAYIFKTVPLSPGKHQLRVVAEKQGYVRDDLFMTLDVPKRKTSLSVATDKSTYESEQMVTITASLIDVYLHQIITDRHVAGALISPDKDVRPLIFVDGRASYTIKGTDVVGKWTVFVNFNGDAAYFPTAGQGAFVVIK